MGRMIGLLNRLKKKSKVIMIKEAKGILKTKQIKLLVKSLLDVKKTKSERKIKIQQSCQVMSLILRKT